MFQTFILTLLFMFSFVFQYNGAPLTDNKKTMKEYGLAHGDVLILQRTRRQAAAQPQQPPASNMPQLVITVYSKSLK
jgi:hypothetical protein